MFRALALTGRILPLPTPHDESERPMRHGGQLVGPDWHTASLPLSTVEPHPTASGAPTVGGEGIRLAAPAEKRLASLGCTPASGLWAEFASETSSAKGAPLQQSERLADSNGDSNRPRHGWLPGERVRTIAPRRGRLRTTSDESHRACERGARQRGSKKAARALIRAGREPQPTRPGACSSTRVVASWHQPTT